MTRDDHATPAAAALEIPIGPATVAVPGDWELVQDGSDGVVVLRLPVPPEEDVAFRPGFVHPNLVLRYLERTPAQGGAAVVAAESLEAARTECPGLVCLHVAPFLTASGLPGRAQLVAGISQRTSFEQARWYIGVGNAVVEIVLSLPVGPQEELRELGEQVALSVAPADGSGVDVSDSVPQVADDHQDRTMMDQVREADVPPQLNVLERNNLSHVGGPVRRGTPPSVGVLSAEAMGLLRSIPELGAPTRFGGSQSSPQTQELISLGLLKDHRLTPSGQHLLDGVTGEPDIHLAGEAYGESTTGEIWFHGDQASMFLGPSVEDLHDGESSRRYVLREWNRSVPTALAWWCGLEADWYDDVAVELDGARLDRLVSRDGECQPPPGDSPLTRELLTGNWSGWNLTTGFHDAATRWICTESRGPLSLELRPPARFVVQGVPAEAIHARLLEIVAETLRTKYEIPEGRC